jgi:hypothetical protein
MTTRNYKVDGLLCTHCMTHQGTDMSFQVVFPNGRKLELASREGADDFVDIVGSDFISKNLTATGDKKLESTYMLMITVAKNASPEKIASGIPESELRTLVDHTRDTLDTLSTDSEWLRTGKVAMHHKFLVKTVYSFSKHPTFIKIFLSNEGMEAVAKLYASRKKNDTPNNCVAELILWLVYNVLSILAREGLSYEKVFSTIEKTGLLGQFIRCVPADPERCADIVERLQRCLQLVKKKLKAGTPTGDILDSVIAGRDGPINEKAKSRLVRLQSLARLSSNNYVSACNVVKSCRNCDKTETQMDGALLMRCQRCKVVYYCSRDCQVADWKRHQEMCTALGSGSVSRSALKASQNTVSSFITSNFFDIAKEVYKKTQELNVPKKELLVEIDFYGDAPALRNEFKVWLTSVLFEGSSVADAPDWFCILYSENKDVAQILREEYEKVTSDNLLALFRASNGQMGALLLSSPGAETGYLRFSDEAVESIGSEDYDRMVASLGQHMTDEYFREKRSGFI